VIHLAERGYVLILLTAVLAIMDLWSAHAELQFAWQLAALLLLGGLTYEGYSLPATGLAARIVARQSFYLGREQHTSICFTNKSSRIVHLQYVPQLPLCFEPLAEPRSLQLVAQDATCDDLQVFSTRLGRYFWPPLVARERGRLGLAFWSRTLPISESIRVQPDSHAPPTRPATAITSGMRPRRVVGAGSELHQLRDYVPGDPLARIAWKATARANRLVTREFSEDQHLDIVVALDAGRLSRVRAGRLDRLGCYANIAARFARQVVSFDDRIGLLGFADQPWLCSLPKRGLQGTRAVQQALLRLDSKPTESDPLAAALYMRRVLKHRALIIFLTDLDDSSAAQRLSAAVSRLMPPHLVVVAGICDAAVSALRLRPARNWRDPWIALAAEEHESRLTAQRLRLQQQGVSVIATSESLLGRATFSEYLRLRRARRI
jgi:uncharacterized protein (DUF58 family)